MTEVNLNFNYFYSIRVSNELGAGNPQAARVAVWAAMFLSITEAVIVSTTLFCCRYVLGHVFSSEKPVVDYVVVMAPLICISVFMDSLQAVLSGSYHHLFSHVCACLLGASNATWITFVCYTPVW